MLTHSTNVYVSYQLKVECMNCIGVLACATNVVHAPTHL
jgi:hypothetical protein